MSQGHDVAVIYSGPVGYATAIGCAQKNASVAMVEKRRNEFYTQLICQEVVIQPYHHSYICYRHFEDDLNKSLKAVENSLQIVLDISCQMHPVSKWVNSYTEKVYIALVLWYHFYRFLWICGPEFDFM
ncbi:MAG: hypothetical protein ACYTE5_05735 [Planctomycetota bacterium]